MESGEWYLLAADLILFIHALLVAFVILGLVLIVVGAMRSWTWVRNPWFRLAHLAVIVVVVLQSWLGEICPLTRWEMALRERAGDAVYPGGFIAHWVETLLYYRLPGWVFVTVYTIFGLVVVATWFRIRPRSFFK